VGVFAVLSLHLQWMPAFEELLHCLGRRSLRCLLAARGVSSFGDRYTKVKRWLATLDLVGNTNNKNTTMTLVEALPQPFIGLVLKLVDNDRSSTANTFGPACVASAGG